MPPELQRTQPVRARRPRRAPAAKPPQGAPSFFKILAMLLLLLAMVVVAAGVGAVLALPPIAAAQFGDPAPNLSLPQQLIYDVRMLSNADALIVPLDSTASARAFEIAAGESVDSVAYRLEEGRLIANADTFRTYLVYAGLDRGVQAGEYLLSPAANALEIARLLQDPLPGAVPFNVLPGWRAEEIAAALPTSGLRIAPQDFMAVVRQPAQFPDLPAWARALPTLEGFLLPGEYADIPRETSAVQLAVLFLDRFDREAAPLLNNLCGASDFTLPQAVALASIVQREAVQPDEQPLIAGVFCNRLDAGMRLESDPTVQYALGQDAITRSWWKVPLSAADLRVDSPYNTYQVYGLPPAPIANPSLSAMRAVAMPQDTPYYFFRALCDGSGRHAFAVTYEEHLQNACP